MPNPITTPPVSMPAPTLLVGALLAEVLPLLQQLENSSIIDHRLVLGEWNSHPIAVLRCSVGPDPAFRNTKRALEKLEVGRIISIGTCGALSDDLQIGDLCTASTIQNESGQKVDIPPLQGLVANRLITVSKPVLHPENRSRLQPNADICEMEAFSVWKAARGIPMHTLKVVSDHAGRDPDPVMSTSLIKAHRIAQFMLRAGKLSREYLVPEINRILSPQSQ